MSSSFLSPFYYTLVDSKFRAKVADFGLSQKSYFRRSAAGTPYWMAPVSFRW
jgi:serine/threonine protein kinase